MVARVDNPLRVFDLFQYRAPFYALWQYQLKLQRGSHLINNNARHACNGHDSSYFAPGKPMRMVLLSVFEHAAPHA